MHALYKRTQRMPGTGETSPAPSDSVAREAFDPQRPLSSNAIPRGSGFSWPLGDMRDATHKASTKRVYSPRNRVSRSIGQSFSQKKCSRGNESETPSQKEGLSRNVRTLIQPFPGRPRACTRARA